jgi:hypothetical protein
MPTLREVAKEAVYNFPDHFVWGIQEVRRHAYTTNRQVIDAGTPLDVHVAGYGVVKFRFTPTPERPEAGASAGEFVPEKG